MHSISYPFVMTAISAGWLLVRLLCNWKSRQLNWRREAQLLLVYICLVVVVRFTFFSFGKVDGKIQPLLFDMEKMLPFRVNWVPFVYLMDYPQRREALLNLFGNITMFIPLGVVWPVVYRELNTHRKVIAAGVGFSMCIEILQLPFFDRVTDLDDLILNSLGFLIGYGLYLFVKTRRTRR